MISLSILSFKWGMGYKKRKKEREERWHAKEAWCIVSEREKMACQRSTTKKKEKYWTQECPRKKNHIAMTSCHSNKSREGFMQEVFYFDHSPSMLHTCTILISLYDLSSPWIRCLILQYMWHKCMLPFLLPWAPHKPSLEVGWKETMPWWGYIYTMSDMRDPMEK